MDADRDRTHSPDAPPVDACRGLRDDPLVRAGHAYADLAGAWFEAERDGLLARADALIARSDRGEDADTLMAEAVRIKHALQTIAHGRWFITWELSRALRDATPDRTGAAAAALAAIEGSETAWRVLADWMDGSATALLVADTLVQLRTRAHGEFALAG